MTFFWFNLPLYHSLVPQVFYLQQSLISLPRHSGYQLKQQSSSGIHSRMKFGDTPRLERILLTSKELSGTMVGNED
jgi:hypothetical protein